MTSRRHTPNQRPRAVDCAVLVIEDNPMTLATTGTVLRKLSGLQVYKAPTGMDGIEMARRHPVALALIDLRLPAGVLDRTGPRRRDMGEDGSWEYDHD